jgi:L-fucose isomerase-like protein
MSYTRSDPAALEGMLIGEIMVEQEVVLLDRVRAMLSAENPRIGRFISWLSSHSVPVRFDEKMLTKRAFDFQVALYLAARDRLDELAQEEPPEAPGICGASIKCHYELSIAPQGCVGCLIPAFLPFGEDAEGPQRAVPVACEGDLNGLVTLALLHTINPEAPPLFGDLAVFRDDHILVRNCGASSVYWAARSTDSLTSLRRISIEPTIHGRSGGCLHFETPAGGPVTFARLFRADGELVMFLGEARIVEETVRSKYSDPWPHTRIVFDSDPYLFYKATPCNHGSITEGSRVTEVETLCAHAGMRVVRCDNNTSLSNFLVDRTRTRGPWVEGLGK